MYSVSGEIQKEVESWEVFLDRESYTEKLQSAHPPGKQKGASQATEEVQTRLGSRTVKGEPTERKELASLSSLS